MTADLLSDGRIEQLRRRLDLGDPGAARPSDAPGTTRVTAPAVRAPLPRRPRPLAKALAKRYVMPVADPVLHRLAAAVAPTVTAMAAERLLGRLEPEVRRLSVELEVLRAEVAATDDRRARLRLDDLTHRFNVLEGRVDELAAAEPASRPDAPPTGGS